MIEALKRLFTGADAEQQPDPEQQRRVAAAALLLEVARADFTQDANEERTMADMLKTRLHLSDEEAALLVEDAAERVNEATSLYEFTRLVNDHYAPEEKIDLVELLWQVAYADDDLDKYEEHLIRRVSELIYVAHEDFIRCKAKARESAGHDGHS